MTRTLLALGDSFSCGEGVGILPRPDQTWVARLAAMLGREPVLLARPGARVADVREHQLPAACSSPADVATLLIGLNDVLQGGLDPHAVREDMCATVQGLRASGKLVVLYRLHDPTAIVPLPPAVRRHLVGKLAAVNRAVDASRGPGVLVADLGAIRLLRRREAWAVDRLHPGPLAQHAIAVAAGELLRRTGLPVRVPPLDPSAFCTPTRYDEGRWMVQYGMPWLARHLGDVAAPLATTLVGRRD